MKVNKRSKPTHLSPAISPYDHFYTVQWQESDIGFISELTLLELESLRGLVEGYGLGLEGY
jgi:hypothetical protein